MSVCFGDMTVEIARTMKRGAHIVPRKKRIGECKWPSVLESTVSTPPHSWTDRTDWLNDSLTHWLTHWLTDWLIYKTSALPFCTFPMIVYGSAVNISCYPLQHTTLLCAESLKSNPMFFLHSLKCATWLPSPHSLCFFLSLIPTAALPFRWLDSNYQGKSYLPITDAPLQERNSSGNGGGNSEKQ